MIHYVEHNDSEGRAPNNGLHFLCCNLISFPLAALCISGVFLLYGCATAILPQANISLNALVLTVYAYFS